MQVILRIEAYNRPGVLDRIAGLTRRKGWNITSLTAGDFDDQISQINVAVSGKDVDIEQIREQLSELDGVRCLEQCDDTHHMIREMLLVRVRRDSPALKAFAGGAEVGAEGDLVFREFTGTPAEINKLVQAAREHGATYVRSGPLVAAIREG